MNGIVVLDKPAGYTSFDCVAVVRRVFGERKLGHTGTLDPAATGVLPICLGRATRLIEYMTASPKRYRCVCRLGVETDTLDLTGSVVGGARLEKGEASVRWPSREALEAVLSRYLGEIEQVPPLYSAVRVNGKRLYEYARQGLSVEVQPRIVRIDSLSLLDYDQAGGEFSFEITCGKGTYVRSLCRDIGRDLGTGAAMASLVRTQAAGFTLRDAVSLAEIQTAAPEALSALLLPPEAGIGHLPRVELGARQKARFFAGNPAFWEGLDLSALAAEPGAPLAVFCGKDFCGIASLALLGGNRVLRAEKVFN